MRRFRVFFEYICCNLSVYPFTIEEQNKILLSKRSNIELSTEKLYDLYPNIPDIKTSIEKCMISYAKLL